MAFLLEFTAWRDGPNPLLPESRPVGELGGPGSVALLAFPRVTIVDNWCFVRYLAQLLILQLQMAKRKKHALGS